ncbi:hypothetical protein AB0A91_10855 [Streptomyces sp. NPDC042207]|uniref:hypothetical protein n=1 Tax=Streptomyces sp. NPDC042207 TaxID=3154331 RepID=UPI0033EC0490
MTRTEEPAESSGSLNYQCRSPLSTRTVSHLAGLLRRHLKMIRSWWRILPPGRIAVIVLTVLRHDQRLADMAGGNNLSESTVRRWRDELIALLAAQLPSAATSSAAPSPSPRSDSGSGHDLRRV